VSGPAASLWRHGDFLRLWSAAGVSAFGARISREGLPMMAVMALGATPLQTGILAALTRGPSLLVGLFAGGRIDRARKRPVLIWADVARALVLAILPAAALLHGLHLWLVYLAAAVVGAASAAFDIAHHAYLPSLIAREQLIEGNSRLNLTDAVAEVGGPVIAGQLFRWLTAPLAVSVNVATYALSALFLLLIRRPEPAPQAQAPPEHVLADAIAGARAALGHPLVRPIVALEVGSALFGSFYSALYTLYALRVLGLTQDLFGLVVALGGVGGLAGAALTPAIVRRFGPGPALAGTAALGSLFGVFTAAAPAGAVPGAVFLGIAQVGGDLLLTGTFILTASLRQSLLPGEVLGRVSGAISAASGLAGVIGALVGGLLGGALGARAVLWIAVAGIIAACLVPLFSPLRSYRGEVEV
jgi:MFS family permease